MAAAADAAAAAAAAAPAAGTLSGPDVARAEALLRGGVMFRRCAPEDLRALARGMHARVFARGEDLVTQGERSNTFWTLASGEALRLRTDPKTEFVHHVDAAACGTTINSLQLVGAEPVFATARCTSEQCRAFGISRKAFEAHLESHPSLARGIIEGLSRDARRRSLLFRTPLLQQSNSHINFSAVAIAAATESYYRSALNSMLNARLSGVKSPLFPNMHIQVPTRVAYITGFKGLRAFLDRNVNPETHAHPNAVRLATMVGPGILMTPVSSFLEACNAGHANPEPLARRSLRGTVPRCGREIIFGIGINQMSDFFEERYRTMSPAIQVSSNPLMANLAGSVTAGMLAGYFSHVPHNLSTFKILEPSVSYRTLFARFVDKSAPHHLILRSIPDALLPATRVALACLFPRGVIM
jgi:CRP-like cAMP-binding protein